jgi:hypothetical protein
MQVSPQVDLRFDRPWFQRLKLKCDVLLSTSAFKFKLRRYTKQELEMGDKITKGAAPNPKAEQGGGQGLTLVHLSAQPELYLKQNTPLRPPNTP